jgi:hypothetical protein
VLSVVAKQIMTIQAALAAGERWFIFEVGQHEMDQKL